MTRASVRLDARELDYLGPFLGFVGDEVSEIGDRHRHWLGAEFAKPRLDLRFHEAGVDLFVQSSR